MADITATLVKNLRDKTGAGFNECKKALDETAGDIEKAVDLLRKKGVKTATLERKTDQGWIGSYVHFNGKVGSMVELRCESDFVAKNDKFQALLKDLCLHVASAPESPVSVRREDVPKELVERERAVYAESDEVKAKPEQIREKIVQGKLDKFYKSRCLLEQLFVKDESKTIDQLVKEAIKSIGENIVVARFVRFKLGE